MKKDQNQTIENPSKPFTSAAGFPREGGVSRRKFLKRSGGATAATFVTWGMLNREASAQSGSGESDSSVSARYKTITYDIKLPIDWSNADGGWVEGGPVHIVSGGPTPPLTPPSTFAPPAILVNPPQDPPPTWILVGTTVIYTSASPTSVTSDTTVRQESVGGQYWYVWQVKYTYIYP